MKLSFLGATKTVTGSKYLLETAGKKFLLDCGLFQGYKELRLRNWAPLPVSPANIDAVMLTHAHIDHSGYLPLLVKNGFSGPIYATKATYELCAILLPDSGHIQEEDARRANKYGYSKHHPALPLYTKEDALRVMSQFKIVDYGKPYAIMPEATVCWKHAGHILGSAFIEIEENGIKTLFTGDMGRLHDPVMRSPAFIDDCDYLIIESTYGDRLHEKTHPAEKLAKIINKTAGRGGTVLIPAFAVGRAQSILFFLSQLKQAGAIPNLPVYLDSPMSINVTKLLCQFSNEHRLGQAACEAACQVAEYTPDVEQSKALDETSMPKIIISASGMATGGRILHHLKYYAPDHRNTIVFTGFQAGGTRGDRILRGEKEVKLLGQMVEINAEVAYLTNTSAHADYEEMLFWLKHFKRAPRQVFITHGELEASESFQDKIEKELQWNCRIPDYLDSVDLT